MPTAKMATAVERSWQQLRVLGIDRIGELLFLDMFDNAPETQHLFPPEVRVKYREWMDEGMEETDLHGSPALKNLSSKVVNAIGFAVVGLHDLEQLVPKLRELGLRHYSYSMSDRHLFQLGKSLIRVLRRCLCDAFSPEVEFAWTMVYSFIQAIMLGGWHEAKSMSGCAQPAPGGMPSTRPSSPRLAAVAESHISMRELAQSQEVGEGCEIAGGLEAYRIDQHLQKAIFGDVFSATGLSTGHSFAIKVLDKDMVQRFGLLNLDDHQFCESPLCEVRFAQMMSGLDNVVQLEDHFSDESSHFIVSRLAVGGDLLEALRLRPEGFPEQEARALMQGAAIGLTSLHQRGLAMQDVSLENMLLYDLDSGDWSVHVCDPGQACTFAFDPITGDEAPAEFHGFVAKEFRPPELFEKKEYLATKVDSWCFGWSCFYLLCAQPLFHCTDPSENDPDWILFQTNPSKLFALKGWRMELSAQAKDFILKLMDKDPEKRMSVRNSLRHPWLAEACVAGATRSNQGAFRRQHAPSSSVTDDDAQSVPSSVGSRATTAVPSPTAASAKRVGLDAAWPVEKKAAKPLPPTLLQHSSQSFKEPMLPIPSKDHKVPAGARRSAGLASAVRHA